VWMLHGSSVFSACDGSRSVILGFAERRKPIIISHEIIFEVLDSNPCDHDTSTPRTDRQTDGRPAVATPRSVERSMAR